MRRWLPAPLVILLATAMVACGGSGDDDEPADIGASPAGTPPVAASGSTDPDEYCDGFYAALQPVAAAYDRSLAAVNDAYQAGDPAAVDDSVTELRDAAELLGELFLDGVDAATDQALSAAFAAAADELDKHIDMIAELDLDDYGDPELTPDGAALVTAYREVLAHCE